MPTIPQQQTIVQYLANSSQTVYTFAFYAPLPTDIQVYLQAPNALPVPAADLLVLNVNYTVTYNTDPITGGFITLLAPPTTGWYLTINRQVQASITTNFQLVQNINGADLDAAFDRLLLLCQQNQNYNLQRNLSYVINTYLPNASPYTQLPPLPQNFVWVGSGSGVVAAQLAQVPSASVLQSMLANNSPGTDGAGLVGYYDVVNNVATTVRDYLNSNTHVTNPNFIIGGDFSLNPWQRGTSFTNPAQGVYTADRFTLLNAGTSAVCNVSQVADSPTAAQAGYYSTHCLEYLVTTNAASVNPGDVYGMWYKFEGFDIAPLGFGQAGSRFMTLSFWHKHTVTGTYTGSVTNSAQNRAYTFEYQQVTTNTWEKASITIAVDDTGTWAYDNSAGLFLFLCMAVGSNFQEPAGVWHTGGAFGTANQVNNLVTISNVGKFALMKLEAGSLSTPYPTELISTVLTKCQRYYEKSYDQGVYATHANVGGYDGYQLSAAPSSNGLAVSRFKVPKRAVPNAPVIYSFLTGTINDVTQDDGSDIAGTIVDYAQSGFSVSYTNTAGRSGALYQWTMNSEL